MTWTRDPSSTGSWSAARGFRLVRITEAGDRRVLEQDTTMVRVLETSVVQRWGESADPGAVWTKE